MFSIALFSRVHPDLGRKIRRATEKQAEDLLVKKITATMDELELPHQPRSKRTALDKNEDLPCTLDQRQPNAGLISGKTGVRGSLFGLE